LRAANILTLDPAAVLAHPRLAQACEPVVARAREHFAEADRVMAKCARKTVRAPRIMSAAYKAILRELTARGFDAPRRPVKVSKPRLLLTILRYAII
jgi:phytoene synthase